MFTAPVVRCIRNAKRHTGVAALLSSLVLFIPVSSAPIAASQPAGGKDKIIVSGASGQIGRLTVKELLARGVAPKNLILVSRTPAELAEYAELGASVRYGDLTKPESLPSAYAGGTRMLLISIGFGPTPRPQLHKAGFDAAVRAGVKHIAYTSFMGAESGQSRLAADHRESENHLKATGVAWTLLRNWPYADGLVEQAAEMLTAGRVVVDPEEVKIAFVTRVDCAAAAAGVLTTPGHENKAYDITGPERVGDREVAALASAIARKPIEVVARAAGTGSSPGPAASAANASIVSTAVADLSGRPATTLRALLEANKDTLLAAARTP